MAKMIEKTENAEKSSVDFSAVLSRVGEPKITEKSVFVGTINGKFLAIFANQKIAFDFLRQTAKNPAVEIAFTPQGYRAAGLKNVAVKISEIIGA